METSKQIHNSVSPSFRRLHCRPEISLLSLFDLTLYNKVGVGPSGLLFILWSAERRCVVGLLNDLSIIIARLPLERLLIRGPNRIEQWERLGEALASKATEESPKPPSSGPEPPEKAPETEIATIPPSTEGQDIATACVPCALGHFSRSAGALNEAVRFKNEGMTSNEILDRLACVLEEQNTLERFDLTPEKLQRTPEWEREIAEEALQRSRQLRHKLEGIETVEQLEQAAAETATYYKKMNRQWYRGRFRHLGADKAEAISQRAGPEGEDG